jgi:hypothetical protein
MSSNVVSGPEACAPAGNQLFQGAAGVICLALLMTSSGAFDTDDLSILHRYALWQVVGALIIGQAILLDARLVRYLPRGRVFRAVAACAAIGLTVLLMTFELHALKFTPLLPKKPDPLFEFAWFVAPPVSAIAGIALLLRQAGSKRVTRGAPSAAAAAEPSALELDSWPDEPVLHVRADDHYLHVVTTKGKSLIRGRMRDAAMRLKDADGLQIHRSHWVADEAVAKVLLRGRDYRLLLEDGTELPVSRSRVVSIREKGWL